MCWMSVYALLCHRTLALQRWLRAINQSINQVYFRIITNDTYRLFLNESQWFIVAVVIQSDTMSMYKG